MPRYAPSSCRRWRLPRFVVTTLAELNASLWAWVERIYHEHVHSETGETPLARYAAGLEQVRLADPESLRRAFLWRERRKSLP